MYTFFAFHDYFMLFVIECHIKYVETILANIKNKVGNVHLFLESLAKISYLGSLILFFLLEN